MRFAGRAAVPAAVVVVLAAFAGRAGEAKDRLRAAASDPDPAARAAAIRALGEDGTPEALVTLLRAERAPAPTVALLEALSDKWREASDREPVPPAVAEAVPLLLARVLGPEPEDVRGGLRALLGRLAPHEVLAAVPREIADRALSAFPPRRDGEAEADWHARLREAFADLAARGPWRREDLPALRARLRPGADLEDEVLLAGALVLLGDPEGLAEAERLLAVPRTRQRFEAPRAHRLSLRAEVEDAGGRRWWLVRSSLAPDRLALAPAAPEGKDRGGDEILTPVKRALGMRGFRLAVDGDEVRVDQPGQEAPAVFRLSEVRRDTDGDGLTDLLEEEWGLCPLLADSDGDGEDDGVDPFPLLPPGPVSDQDLVREAVLAVMRRSEAGELYVRPDAMPRVQVEPGGRTRYLPEGGEGEGRFGVKTLCRLDVRLDASRAEVSVMRSLGRLASRWWTAFLRKAGGRWFVVATRFDGMS